VSSKKAEGLSYAHTASKDTSGLSVALMNSFQMLCTTSLFSAAQALFLCHVSGFILVLVFHKQYINRIRINSTSFLDGVNCCSNNEFLQKSSTRFTSCEFQVLIRVSCQTSIEQTSSYKGSCTEYCRKGG
jgi:hypothetical protein